MRRTIFAAARLLSAAALSPLAAETPCTVGFDYSIDVREASPGQSFHLNGSWGEEQLDRLPDLITGGEMQGGRGRLEVLEWTQDRVRVRVAPNVRPGPYSVSVFCGERHQFVSPFKPITVLEPNPNFDYSLSPSAVRAGETLELRGNWRLRMDRRPILVYERGRSEVELEVLDWTDDAALLQIPVFVDGEELVEGDDALAAEIRVDSEQLYLMAGYRPLEILPPTAETLRLARIELGLVAPWIGESPKNLAIAAGAAFLFGAVVLGLGGMLAATADFALAAVFLIAWVWPLTFGRNLHSELGLLFFVEFIVIHASAFLVALSTIDTTSGKKAGIVGGCSAFYTLSLWGYSHANGTLWPLVFFWTLILTKFVPLFTRHAREWDRGMILARVVGGTLAYLLAVFCSAVLPVPRFSWPEGSSFAEGMFDAEPYRLMFAGALYFLLMGLYESWVARVVKEPGAALYNRAP